MKACRKNAWAITTMAAVAVSFAVTTVAVAGPDNTAPPRISPASWDAQMQLGTTPPSGVNAGVDVCESTGFEAAEASCGWETGWICGSTFTNCGGPPNNSGCDPDPLIAEDCCELNPNPLNGWYTSIANQHCNEPHVDTVNPAAGTQHLRMGADAAGGNPPGCVADFEAGTNVTACRVSAFTPTTGGPLPIGPTTIEFDVAMELQPALPPFGSHMIYFGVGDNDPSGNTVPVSLFFDSYGILEAFDFELGSYQQVGFLDGNGTYQHLTIEHNVCDETTIYTLSDSTTGEVDGQYVANTNFATQGFTMERAIFQSENVGGSHDIDNYSVVRGEECVTTCGADGIEPGEQCEVGDPESPCPDDRCVDCFCTSICTGAEPCVLENGLNGPFLGPFDPAVGGIWVLDSGGSPAVAVDFCGTEGADSFMVIYDEMFTPLSQNDDCEDGPFGEGLTTNAPCYNNIVPGNWEACTCASSEVGTTYFVQNARLVGPGAEFWVNVQKKAVCDGELVGACCDTSPGSGGVCTDNVPEAECQGPQQIWTSNGKCADVTCEEARGACCDGLVGSCQNNTLQAQCACEQCTWTKGASCSAVTCNPALGACCDTGTEDPLVSICEQTTMADCNCEKCSWTKDTPCSAIVCDPNFIPIPTVSEWGLVIMALLLLVGGKVYFGRRQTATA